jgi:predicted Rossmann fold nucleotide-binding protein DprA/Smf involved in DNA uptake
VCAVPGGVHSPASTGTNGLIVDGCTPVRDVDDVLIALSLARGGPPLRAGGGSTVATDDQDPVAAMGRVERAVWDAIDDSPTTVETVLLRTNLSLAALTEAGLELISRGFLVGGAGWWTRT